MNWKSSVLLLFCLSHPVWGAVADNIETYDRLQMQLQKDPARTLSAIELFEKQVQSADAQSKSMAYYLHLQACIALNRYACAAKSTEQLRAVTQDEEKRRQLTFLSAQLHYQIQDHETVIARARQWLALTQRSDVSTSVTQKAELLSLQSYSFFHLSKFTKAAKAMKQSVAYQASEGRYRFLFGVYQQMDQWEQANRTLAYILSHYPTKKSDWDKFVYSFLKLDKSEEALNALGSAYKSGRLSNKSIMLYAQLLLQHQAATRMVTILEHHPELSTEKHYSELLSQGYLLIRDKSKAAKWLAKMETKNNHTTRGLLAYEQGHWQQAATLFYQLDPTVKENHYWYLLVGISEFELEHWSKAKQAFKTLENTEYADIAKQWVNQIDYLTSDIKS